MSFASKEEAEELEKAAIRTPLEPVFTEGGSYIVWYMDQPYGSFIDPDVAHAWASDAFGYPFKIRKIKHPWYVLPEDRKS